MKEIIKKCPCCGKIQCLTVEKNAYKQWINHELLIQDAFPTLTPDQREILISGICHNCWNNMFN